jgi:hypothetical protein
MWIKWKKEFSAYEKPVKPPVIELPSSPAERQNLLYLMQAGDSPRHHSVFSTEGDLATHRSSTNKTPSGRRIADVMHPRLTVNSREWGKQYVVFEPSASCPFFLLTITKTRSSPFDGQLFASHPAICIEAIRNREDWYRQGCSVELEALGSQLGRVRASIQKLQTKLLEALDGKFHDPKSTAHIHRELTCLLTMETSVLQRVDEIREKLRTSHYRQLDEQRKFCDSSLC